MTTSTPPPSGGDPAYGSAWSFSSESGAGAAPEAQPRPRHQRGTAGRPVRDPLSTRLLQVAGLLAVLLFAVIANAALHSDGNPLNPVAEAAQRTERIGGARIAAEYTYTAAGLSRTVVGHGHGAYDARTGRTRMVVSTTDPGHGPVTVEAVGDDRTVFMRSGPISASLPAGRPWLAMQPFLGHSTQSLGSGGNPKSSLEMLQAVGDDVEEKGEATIRGHATTVYAGTIQLGHVRALLERRGEVAVAREFEELEKLSPAPVPVEVWVDENGLARRVRLVQQLPESAGEPVLTMDMTMEMFDFGTRPTIELPPPSASVDVTPLVRAELHLLNGEKLAPLMPSGSGAPMSGAEFHRRGSAICRGAHREMAAVARSTKALGKELEAAGVRDYPPRAKLAELRRFAAVLYRPVSDLALRATRRFARLSPPPALAAAYEEAVHDLAVSSEAFSAEAVAVEVGAMTLWKKIEAETKSRSKRENELWRRIGLDGCGDDQAEAAFHSEASIE